MNTETLRGLFWDCAVTKKLYETALRERRFEDASRHLKQLKAIEFRFNRGRRQLRPE